MGFIAALRHAEEQSRNVAKHTLNEIAHEVREAETAVRRRMRVHPQPSIPTDKNEQGLRPVPTGENSLRPIVSKIGRASCRERV